MLARRCSITCRLSGSIVPKGFRKPRQDEPILSALELIAEAERPLLYVGGGAISAGADSLRVIASAIRSLSPPP